MGQPTPKQYLPLHGRPVIEHTLQRLLQHPLIEDVVVALGADDAWWPATRYCDHPNVQRVDGGAERSDSVLGALSALASLAAADDWVLVHDAARPCLRREDLDRLIDGVSNDTVGGLLAVPVHDTVKQSDAAGRVQQTLPRERLWRAYTPQMFRLGRLRQALEQARARGQQVTDDASAMELAGYYPRLIKGCADNIKITRPEDLVLAAFYLQQQREQVPGEPAPDTL